MAKKKEVEIIIPPLYVTNGVDSKLLEMDQNIYILLYKIITKQLEKNYVPQLDYPVIEDTVKGIVGFLQIFNNKYKSVRLFITNTQKISDLIEEEKQMKICKEKGLPIPESKYVDFYKDVKKYKLSTIHDANNDNKLIFKLIKKEGTIK